MTTKPLREWKAYEHIDKACDLLDNTLVKGRAERLTLAQVHIAIAQAKMTGRGRA